MGVLHMTLTDQQLNFFHNFGYLVIPQLFNPEEMDWIIEEYENVLQNHAGGAAVSYTHLTLPTKRIV